MKIYQEILQIEKTLENPDLTDEQISQLQNKRCKLLQYDHYIVASIECVHNPDIACTYKYNMKICAKCKKN
ncbi:MAG: hypothetical protein FWF66_00745 [Candidatus Bathyarchaeota archaeon]|nr:hypothetical protein [Candidatus Termiticorpusculum sp.]